MPKELGRDSSNLNQEKRKYLFYRELPIVI